MDKTKLVQQLRQQLAAQEQTMQRAADAARENATHEESKPENDKDTRALEASYLAGAQAAKARELKAAQNGLAFMQVRAFGPDDPIAISALVHVLRDGKRASYFVAPFAGGEKLGDVTVVTPASALGQLLLGKRLGDVVEMGSRVIEIEDVQ